MLFVFLEAHGITWSFQPLLFLSLLFMRGVRTWGAIQMTAFEPINMQNIASLNLWWKDMPPKMLRKLWTATLSRNVLFLNTLILAFTTVLILCLSLAVGVSFRKNQTIHQWMVIEFTSELLLKHFFWSTSIGVRKGFRNLLLLSCVWDHIVGGNRADWKNKFGRWSVRCFHPISWHVSQDRSPQRTWIKMHYVAVTIDSII